MRDIQQVLERWGAWVADHHEAVCWPSVAAGFASIIPKKIKSRPKCCDEDGMIISDIMARLHRQYPVAHDLLFDYYIFGKTFMQLAREYHCSDTHIGKKLQNAEGMVDGYLMALDVRLEMDADVWRKLGV